MGGLIYLDMGDVEKARADLTKACDMGDEGACDTLDDRNENIIGRSARVGLPIICWPSAHIRKYSRESGRTFPSTRDGSARIPNVRGSERGSFLKKSGCAGRGDRNVRRNSQE